MLRSAPPAAVEEKAKGGDYRLFLLPDNSDTSLKTVQSIVNGGNAILLYPDAKDKSRAASRKYKACFILNGILRVHPISKILEEVPMGNRAIHVATKMPCDITAQLNAANLIKVALARAGIRLATLFRIPPSVICTNVLPGMQHSSLAAFAESSFYSHKLAQSELDQRKLFTHILRFVGNAISRAMPYGRGGLTFTYGLLTIFWSVTRQCQQIRKNKIH